MRRTFDIDPHPGRPRVLFIGLAESTHTHSWIDLLDDSDINIRLFALPSGLPPNNWRVRTYVTAYRSENLDSDVRLSLYPLGIRERLSDKLRRASGTATARAEQWLADVIRQWLPHIIHTLGLDPQAFFYSSVRERFSGVANGQWVLQLRGGSDLALARLDPKLAPRIARVLRACDQLVSDNEQDFSFALDMGVRAEQISTLGTVPGTGGVDVDLLARSWAGPPSTRRMILWPKAYEESPCSKALPVFEAMKVCWDRIQPCEIHMLAVTPQVRMWYRTLPPHIRAHCHMDERVPRARVLDLMVQARVMLAPSLVDGTPNTMFEAMAAGALPVVSPLDTIRPVVQHERNALFARNLYPDEIAAALCRAMSDDDLVDAVAQRNLDLVRRLADRSTIRPRVVAYYEKLAERSAGIAGNATQQAVPDLGLVRRR